MSRLGRRVDTKIYEFHLARYSSFVLSKNSLKWIISSHKSKTRFVLTANLSRYLVLRIQQLRYVAQRCVYQDTRFVKKIRWIFKFRTQRIFNYRLFYFLLLAHSFRTYVHSLRYIALQVKECNFLALFTKKSRSHQQQHLWRQQQINSVG